MAQYLRNGTTLHPAGVAYTHPTMGYQTVNLGFPLEGMFGALCTGDVYKTGAPYRVDFMANVMEYFGKEPTGPGTGVSTEPLAQLRLAPASPNPFASSTRIAYSARAGGRVTVRIYDLAGRLVRTLVDGPVEPGEHEATWDGRDEAGARVASGVYCVQLDTGSRGESARRKIVVLR